MTVLAIFVQGALTGAAFVGLYVWWRSHPPSAKKEMQRGHDEAEGLHRRGLNLWAIKGFIDIRRGQGYSGPYEMGMMKYINKNLRTDMK